MVYCCTRCACDAYVVLMNRLGPTSFSSGSIVLHGYVVKLGVTEACLASMASGMILAAFMQCTPNFSRHPIR